jgi:hypothetical protein
MTIGIANGRMKALQAIPSPRSHKGPISSTNATNICILE